jgi:nucleotide-binding universal stress UspA family protein
LQEWREEFMRRFCPVSPGVSVTVELVSGPAVATILDLVARERADAVVATWDGKRHGRHSPTLVGVMTGSPCPVVVAGIADAANERPEREASAPRS